MNDKIRPIDANAVRRKAEWIAMEFHGRGNELGEAIAEVLGECVDEEHAAVFDSAQGMRHGCLRVIVRGKNRRRRG